VLQIVNGDNRHALIDEVDLVIRTGPLKDPDLMARRLFRSQEIVIAAPHLAQAPVQARDLSTLPWIVMTRSLPPNGYRLTSATGETLHFMPTHRIETNSSEHAFALMRAGLGVGIMLEGLSLPGVVPLGWTGRTLDFMLAHAGGTRPSRLVRTLADLVMEEFELGALRG
jgi:DNA-binding transcriptional LysR family regulator